jgi:hypothetical protein
MRGGASGAPAEDRQMGAIELKAALLAQSLFETVRELGRRVDHVAAVVADDVDVVVLGGSVRRCAVVKVGVPHHADLLEQFEGAVHGGEIDAVDGVENLLRRCVPEFSDGEEDALALCRDAQPPGV